jgi:hypothetical protein
LGVDTLEPSSNRRVFSAPTFVKEEHEATSDDTDDEQIGEGKAVANEVCLVTKVILHDLDPLQRGIHAFVDFLLVEWTTTD